MHNVSLALDGAWRVLVAGLLLGAGLPAIFALGVRSMAYGFSGDAGASTGVDASASHLLGRAVAAVLFAIVLVAVGPRDHLHRGHRFREAADVRSHLPDHRLQEVTHGPSSARRHEVDEGRSNFLARFLEWMRKGYPTGVPRQDYVVLLGLLRRKLTDAEVMQVADDLAAHAEADGDPISRKDIERMISDALLQHASDEDVARVSARLAAGGWPLADPPSQSSSPPPSEAPRPADGTTIPADPGT
jgi:Protein of unknown function (DUF3349)